MKKLLHYSHHLGAPAKQNTRKVQPLNVHLLFRLSEFILQHGLEIEGIFRLCGSVSAMKAIREQLDTDPLTPLPTTDITSALVIDISGIFSTLIREQKHSLIPFSLYQELVSSLSSNSLTPLSTAISKIPSGIDRVVLRIVLNLLHQIQLKKEINKMTPTNLGVCFAPTLLSNDSDDSDLSLLLSTDRCDVIAAIIENFPKLFNDGVVTLTELNNLTSQQQQQQQKLIVHRQLGVGRAQSNSITHQLWFQSFPGLENTQKLLNQAEIAANEQLKLISQSTPQVQISTATTTTTHTATNDDLQIKLRKTNTALSSVIMKLVEVVREKAALEEENASLRERLSLAEDLSSSNSDEPINLQQSNSNSNSNSTQSPLTTTTTTTTTTNSIPNANKDDQIMEEANKISKAKQDGIELEIDPGILLGRLVQVRDGICSSVELALPQSSYASLPRIEEMIRRSGQMVSTIAPTDLSGIELKKLLDDASDQLHTATIQMQRTNSAIRLSVNHEINAAAKYLIASAISGGEIIPSRSSGSLGIAYATVHGDRSTKTKQQKHENNNNIVEKQKQTQTSQQQPKKSQTPPAIPQQNEEQERVPIHFTPI